MTKTNPIFWRKSKGNHPDVARLKFMFANLEHEVFDNEDEIGVWVKKFSWVGCENPTDEDIVDDTNWMERRLT